MSVFMRIPRRSLMENFGILLSVPVALLMSMVYCRFLAKAVREAGTRPHMS